MEARRVIPSTQNCVLLTVSKNALQHDAGRDVLHCRIWMEEAKPRIHRPAVTHNKVANVRTLLMKHYGHEVSEEEVVEVLYRAIPLGRYEHGLLHTPAPSHHVRLTCSTICAVKACHVATASGSIWARSSVSASLWD